TPIIFLLELAMFFASIRLVLLGDGWMFSTTLQKVKMVMQIGVELIVEGVMGWMRGRKMAILGNCPGNKVEEEDTDAPSPKISTADMDLQKVVFANVVQNLQRPDIVESNRIFEKEFIPAIYELNPIPESQALDHRAMHFLEQLAEACERVERVDNTETLSKLGALFQSILGNHSTTMLNSLNAQSEVMAVDSLENIARRCVRADENISANIFAYMINCIQLRNKVISTVLATHHCATAILNTLKYLNRSPSTIYRYFKDGAKYTIIANAGSVFLLGALAVEKERHHVPLAHITADILMKINHTIRCPKPGTIAGALVEKSIIPAIAYMRQTFRM
ncbi:hypothetical protein BDN70DRAFT_902322, partial [Pholiota conissans]